MSIDRCRFPTGIREDHVIQCGQIAGERHEKQRSGLDASAEEIHVPTLQQLLSNEQAIASKNLFLTIPSEKRATTPFR